MLYEFDRRRLLDLHRLVPFRSVAEPELLITPDCCPVIAGVERLRELLDRITCESLRTFNRVILVTRTGRRPELWLRLAEDYRF